MLTTFLAGNAPALAMFPEADFISAEEKQDLKNKKDPGTPVVNDPGTTRPENNCDETDHPMTAIVMNKGQDLTLSPNPTLWFYVPYTNNQVSQVEFILKDESDRNTLHVASGEILDGSGLLRVIIPEDKFSLTENELYHWYFQVYCGGDLRETPDKTVEGWIRQVPSSEVTSDIAFESAALNDVYRWYTTNDVWYDAIHVLIESILLESVNSVEEQTLENLFNMIDQNTNLSSLDVTTLEEIQILWDWE